MHTQKKTVAFFTLGCKLNFSETSFIAAQLLENGYLQVDFKEKADIYIINTCSVTATADKKCRAVINKAVRQNPDAFVLVTGCYAQLKPNEMASMKGVDLVLGSNDKFNILEYIKRVEEGVTFDVDSCNSIDNTQFHAAFSSVGRTRSFLKVQDGCDYKCTYCTIPAARGNSRNGTIAEVLQETEKIANAGVKEIILTGVNVGDFGKSTGETFFELVKALEESKLIPRIRISSIEPNLITEEIIRYVSISDCFVPHFHIPLQSGCNKILSAMSRRYKRELFAEKVNMIKRIMPEASVGADVIVGFPGETNDDFNDTVSFVEGLPLSYLHVFSYSVRPGTPAADFPNQVNSQDKDMRSKKLHKVSEKMQLIFNTENTGKELSVLFEKDNHKGLIKGFSDNYVRVSTTFNSDLCGNVEKVKTGNIAPDGSVSCELI